MSSVINLYQQMLSTYQQVPWQFIIVYSPRATTENTSGWLDISSSDISGDSRPWHAMGACHSSRRLDEAVEDRMHWVYQWGVTG